MPSTALLTLAELGLPDRAHHIHALYALVPDTPGPTDAAYTDLIGILGSDAIPVSELRELDLEPVKTVGDARHYQWFATLYAPAGHGVQVANTLARHPEITTMLADHAKGYYEDGHGAMVIRNVDEQEFMNVRMRRGWRNVEHPGC